MSTPQRAGAQEADSPMPNAPSGGCMRPFAAVLIALIVLMGVGGGVLIGRWSAPKPPPAKTLVVKSTPDVVTAVRDLARLEGAQYHVERVIDLTDKQSHFFGLIHSKDAILLVAAGDVTAGVDLSGLKPEDVTIDEQKKTARFLLPAPRILSSRLDNKHTYVKSRTTDLLAKRDESLETRARKEAEKAIVQAARNSGILERARRSVTRTVTSLARSLGYSDVQVKYEDQ